MGILVVSFFASSLSQPTAQAQTNSDLASQYAPVLHFTAGEKFYPTSVDYIIESSQLKQRASGTPTVVDSAPTVDSLGTYVQGELFLDNKLGIFDDIAADYSLKLSRLGYTVYANIAQSSSGKVIQYWFFYIYNNGPLNDHQGDIEVVEVFLDNAGNPQTALYSQHGAGQNTAWSNVEKTGDHPVVYVAQGSHANYFRSCQGKIGIENDVVASDGKTLNPTDYSIEMLDSQGWLDFPGRWGYWGTDSEMALGLAGPYGPVFNQDGIRWAQPQTYLNQTFAVDGTYLTIAWLAASFLLFFLIYIAARAAWKCWCIYRIHRKGGLFVDYFLRGRGSIGLALGIASIVITTIALFVPWYTISAVSQNGQLAQAGGVNLLSIDGVHGVTAHMFLGVGNSDSSSGYVTLFTTQLPFAIIIAAGIILLALDVIGIKSGKSFGKKLWIGIIGTIIPLILVLVFISQLPALLPLANGLLPGSSIPPTVEATIRAIAASPIGGTTTTQFPVFEATSVSWGLALGAYLFLVAIILRIVGGFILYTTPELLRKPPAPTPAEAFPLPPPPT